MTDRKNPNLFLCNSRFKNAAKGGTAAAAMQFHGKFQQSPKAKWYEEIRRKIT